jgi:hypothetical protein
MAEGRDLWFSRRALTLHAVIIVIVPTFTALCIWQVNRALNGNNLSWAYVFEWPFFAGYAVYMWWRFVHETPPAAAARVVAAVGHRATEPTDPTLIEQTAAAAELADADDPDAADRLAYNRYLAELAAQDKPKTW